MERPITFNNAGAQLVGVLHLPDTPGAAPGVLLCHGFTGTKSESHFVFTKLARALADSGIAALRFDFRGSGDSEGRFQDMTISGEISDALCALDVFADLPEVDGGRLGILGLSLGGCVAACVAGRSDAVRATVLWAPVHHPHKQFTRREIGPEVAFPFEFSGGMLLGKGFVDELPDIDPVAEILAARGPVLVLHGTEDESIPCEWSQAYVEALTGAGLPAERETIQGADHTFADVAHERAVIERSVGWFATHLRDARPVGEMPPAPKRVTYADAGVDIEAANFTKDRLRELVRESYTPRVLTELGSFGGLFRADFPGMEDPVLVASTDGVGTKLKIAVMANRHDTVGADLVNHCVNDILVMGARPLFFQDYVALGRHESDVVTGVVGGLARACAEVGCALLGGETAEMPDMYAPGEYDLAGTVVGIVDRPKILDGSRVSVGDALIGLASDGLHTNGYSLARRLVFDEAGWGIDHRVPEWECAVGDELLKTHRCYLRPIEPLLEDDAVHAMAHITGGGITDNLPRVLPDGVAAKVYRDTWDIPPVFTTLYRLGNLDEDEALHAFNMGIGMILVVAADVLDSAMESLAAAGERVWHIGEVIEASGETGVQYA